MTRNSGPIGLPAPAKRCPEHAGIDHVGIGADFYDAGSSMVPGLQDVSHYPYLFAELLRRGYRDDDLLKIAGRNHLRAMRQMEKATAP